MNRLFSEVDAHSALEQGPKLLEADIAKEPEDYLLNASEVDLAAHYVSKYRLDVPELDVDGIYVHDRGEVEIDVSGDPMRSFAAFEGPLYVGGTRVTIAVPFSGSPTLFTFHPNQFTFNPPRALVRDGELHLVYEGVDQTSEQIKSAYQTDVSTISQWLGWLRAQLTPFNEGLESMALTMIRARKEKILKNREMVASLGLPIRPREGEAKTYTVPDVRRRPRIAVKPKASSEPFKPEPALAVTTFEQILAIVKSMAHVMERSPSAFKTMGEEDLRQHFLVQLNGQFEGDASGETFNYQGKTDILIRRDDRNVFVGECKFWAGPKTIGDTIDQILSYLTWRDTKAAIVLFVRNKKMTSVLEQIPELVESHANYKKSVEQRDETDFRFVFGQRDDPNREIHLAVLAFAVPAKG